MAVFQAVEAFRLFLGITPGAPECCVISRACEHETALTRCLLRLPPHITAMNHTSYSDAFLRDLLNSVRTIAVVGASPRPHRPSHGVMRYLQRHGYRAIPVNPLAVGETILGERCVAALADIGEPVDMVDIFRRSELAGAAVDEAIAIGARAIWMQLGVVDETAAARAEAEGLKVVMNRCPAIEIPRLGLTGI